MRIYTVSRNTCQASASARGASWWVLSGVARTLACLVLLGTWTPPVVAAQTPKQIMDDLDWEDWKGCKDTVGTKDYLTVYPDGAHAAEARECLPRLAWDDIKDCREREPVEQFLKDFPGSVQAQEAEECLKRFGIGRKLEQCRWLVERKALTSGAYGSNALECYREVLEQDPGNEQAQEGIAGIEEHYSQRADQAMKDHRPEDAEAAIDRLRRISPEHPRIERLAAKLNKLKDVLDREEELAKLRAQVEALLAQGKLGEARSRLATARKQGLRDKTLKSLENRLGEAEAERERVLDESVAKCGGLLSGGRVAEARDCSLRVLELEPGHAGAAEILQVTNAALAWGRAQDMDTVESYYRFEQEFPRTQYVRLARSRLKAREEAYWKQVQETGTVEAYRRYLEIYPNGRFAAKARQRI